MQALALVCDFAEVLAGKLYLMGAGWTDVVTRHPLNFALAVRLEVPYDRTGSVLSVTADLRDEDGRPAPAGSPVRTSARVEVGRPAGLPAGSPVAVPLAWSFVGVPLPAGRYSFHVGVDSDPVTRVSFAVHQHTD